MRKWISRVGAVCAMLACGSVFAADVAATNVKVKVQKTNQVYVTVAMVATVTNQSQREIDVVVMRGLDKDGFKVDTLHLKGAVKAGESKQITGQALLKPMTFVRSSNGKLRTLDSPPPERGVPNIAAS